MVTKTLLLAGEGSGLFAVPAGSGGPLFRALDKKTGETLFEFKLPANQSGIPMTYLAGGKQYIVLAVGAVGVPGEFVALTVDN
jgi:quinoprotein glucose dehydrogenase